MSYFPKFLESGGVLQAGMSTSDSSVNPASLLLRGVVLATYVADDPNYPNAAATDAKAAAVYCDVLCYTGWAGMRYVYFTQVLVSQDVGGMQRGHIWKPRAASIDVTGNTFDVNQATNPADMDGDHVLVGFMDGNVSNPVILRGIPHPSVDIGRTASDAIGVRTQLVLADGDPDFIKHHGSFYGITDTGDFKVDTSSANDGSVDANGFEPAPPTDGSKGNHLYNIEQHSQRLTSMLNMGASPPTAVMTELFALAGYILDFMAQTPAWQIKAGSNNVVNLANSGAATTMAVGDGSKHVAIVESLQTLWGSLVTYLNNHQHPTGVGPSGFPVTMATTWDSSINSTKVSIPNG